MKIAFFMNNAVGHRTGGRLHSFMTSCALVELGYEVQLYTDRVPVFMADFTLYRQPELRIVESVSAVDVKADCYFGTPVDGTYSAARCAKKYKRRAFCLIFDPLPAMKRLGRSMQTPDMTDIYWDAMLHEMRNKWVTAVFLAECWIRDRESCDWVGCESNTWLYPAVNSRVLDSVPEQRKENSVIWCSRIVSHKLFPHALDASSLLNVKLVVVSPRPGREIGKMIEERGMEGYVELLSDISDAKKFAAMKAARASLLPSLFEGFGIQMVESLTAGVPFVGYEIPSFCELRENTPDGVYLAKLKDRNDLRAKLVQALERGPVTPPNTYRFESLCERVKEILG